MKPALDGSHIGETWRMILNCPCAVAMRCRLLVKLFRPLVFCQGPYDIDEARYLYPSASQRTLCSVASAFRRVRTGYRTTPTTVGISRTWRPRCSRPWMHGWSSVPPDWINPGPTTVFVYAKEELLFRPHRSTTYVDAAHCYRPSSVVCRSVCRSVCHTSQPCKNGWTDRDAVWVEDSGGPKEPCRLLHGVQIPHGKRQFCGGKGRPIVKNRDTLRSSVQKRLSRSTCRLGCRLGLGWAVGIMCYTGVQRCPGTLPWQPLFGFQWAITSVV